MEVPSLSGEEMRFRRKKRLAMTQTELASLLGVTTNHVCNLEKRDAVPPAIALAVLYLEQMNRAAA